MQETNSEKTPPVIGLAPELETKAETLPALKIKNKVIWRNENFNAPFIFEKGKESPFGIFLDPRQKRFFVRKKEIGFLEVAPEHGRSGLMSRVVFKDENGQWYRDIDLKGVGLVKMKFGGLRAEGIEGRSKFEVSGLQGLAAAYYEAEMGEGFVQAGIRTDRIIAILKVKEVITPRDGILSIPEAKKLKYIPETFEPVISVRAYGTKSRVNEQVSYEKKKLLLNDARILVAQELKIDPPNAFSFEDYIRWFAKTLGENIGRMHNKGWFHQYLWSEFSNPQNVTLDCRITDRDSVGFLKDLKKDKRDEHIVRDVDSAQRVIRDLMNELIKEGFLNEGQPEQITLWTDFNREYEKYCKHALPRF